MSCHGHLMEGYAKIVCNCGTKIKLTGDFPKDTKKVKTHIKQCKRQKQYKDLPGLVELELTTQILSELDNLYQTEVKQ